MASNTVLNLAEKQVYRLEFVKVCESLKSKNVDLSKIEITCVKEVPEVFEVKEE